MLQSCCASFSCNSMPHNGCSALHGVNHNKKKILSILKLYFGKNNLWKMEALQIFDLWDQEIDSHSQITKPLILTLHFRFRKFILFVQTKKWLPWALTATQAAKHIGGEWGLTWYLQSQIYSSNPTWTQSQNSLAATGAPSLKISSHGTSLK